MDDSIEHYWQMRLESCKKSLEENRFGPFIAKDAAHAREIVLKEILPRIEVKTMSWGDSMTFYDTGLLNIFRRDPDLDIIETFDSTISREESIERRRQALLADLFVTGTNAVTEKGQLVNLDMIGNRVAGITFGPKHVIIFVGRNKIVPDLEAAMFRIRNYAAPTNAIRHHIKTPCVETSYCQNCKSPQRICNTWTITEKSFPKDRIKVILINGELGL
ncbi:lactate utilization protein [Desulfobacterales bacterium HSG2]|nr:lactate utilization protein [Desulfobacterales bacterium HSG2]